MRTIKLIYVYLSAGEKIVGQSRDLWNYNDKAWLGITLAYDLFKLGNNK